jgi:sigma-B regulation protein RsbU (phosphoserine phosphatase)
MRRDRPLLLAVIVMACGALLHHAAYTWRTVRFDLTDTAAAQQPIGLRGLSSEIDECTPAATAAGISVADRLEAIEGRPYTGRSQLSRAIWSRAPGSSLRLTIQPHDARSSPRDVTVRLSASRVVGQRSTWDVLLTVLLSLLLPAFCIATGVFVVASRPRDPIAWIVLLMMFSFAQFGTDRRWPIDSLPPIWSQIAAAYHTFFMASWPAWMLAFGIYFGEPLPLFRRLRWLAPLCLGPQLFRACLELLVAVGAQDHQSSVAGLAGWLRQSEWVWTVLGMAAIGAFFMLLGIKFGIAQQPDVRRRFKLLSFGASVALAPTFVLLVIDLVRGVSPLESWPEWVAIPAIGCLFLFPLSLAYVIVVHRALDVRVVIRLGLQYALTRAAVRSLQLLLSGVAVWFTLAAISRNDARRVERVRAAGLGGLGVVLVTLASKRAQAWTDRRFFRDVYDAEQVLADISERLRTEVELRNVLAALTDRVGEALHVAPIAVLLADQQALRIVAHSGLKTAAAELAIDLHGPLAQRLLVAGGPLRVYPDDPRSWIHDLGAETRELEQLAALGAQLLLPLTQRDALLGVISLGPKRSDEAYSPRDLRLLESLATQAAFAVSNHQLAESLAREAIQRERMRREMEIAREVQERLFPQSIPQRAGLELGGRCRPAMGVGGDYYDFLELPDGRVGIAIGDVAGKGIPAALLMSSLRAALRGQAISGISDLSQLMDHVNTLVYDASTANRYATFFYAEYEPNSRALRYCNAGHNPPMLLRGDGSRRELIRLDRGGTVVGLLEGVRYEQAKIVLARGDRLVMFTDGISEARNLADEDWGEERLLIAIESAGSASAAGLIEELYQVIDQFAAGAPQHDDMTVVVALIS